MNRFIIAFLLCLWTVPLMAGFTETDKKHFNQFSTEYQKLSTEMRAVRGPQKWVDTDFTKKVNTGFANLKVHVDAMSDPQDPNARKMLQSYENLQKWYDNVRKRAEAWKAKQNGVKQEIVKPSEKKAENKTEATNPENKGPGPLDYQNKRNLGFFNKDLKRYQGEFENVTPEKEKALRGYITNLENRLDKLTMKNNQEVVAAAKKVEGLKAKMMIALGRKPEDYNDTSHMKKPLSPQDKSALHNFNREYQRTAGDFKNIDPIALQNPKVKANYQRWLKALDDRLTKFQDPNSSQAQDCKKRFEEQKSRLNAASVESEKLAASAGDIEAQLAAVQKEFPISNWQPQLKEPYTPSQIKCWAKDLKAIDANMPDIMEFFDNAEKTSIKARSKDFKAYKRWFKGMVPRIIKESIKDTRGKWVRNIRGPLQPLKLNDSNLQNEDFVKSVMFRLNTAEDLLAKLNAFDNGYYGKDQQDTIGFRKQLKDYWGKFKKGKERALKNSRMPPDKVNDPELRKVAKAMAENPKYGFKPYVRLVVNSPLEKHSKLVWARNGWHLRKWDDFQACIAEKDGNDIWVRVLNIRYFHEAEPKVPVKKWIVSDSYRSKRILPENVDK